MGSLARVEVGREGAPAMNPRPSIRTDISGVPERAGRSFSWKP